MNHGGLGFSVGVWLLLWELLTAYTQLWILCTQDKRHKGSTPDSSLAFLKSQAHTFDVSVCSCPEIASTNFLVMKFLAHSAQSSPQAEPKESCFFLDEVSKAIMGICRK